MPWCLGTLTHTSNITTRNTQSFMRRPSERSLQKSLGSHHILSEYDKGPS